MSPSSVLAAIRVRQTSINRGGFSPSRPRTGPPPILWSRPPEEPGFNSAGGGVQQYRPRRSLSAWHLLRRLAPPPSSTSRPVRGAQRRWGREIGSRPPPAELAP